MYSRGGYRISKRGGGGGDLRLPIKKKVLFPVQRVAKIVAPHFSFFWIGKYCPFLGGGGGISFAKKMKEKKSPVAPFLVTRPLNRKHSYFYGQPE